MNKSMEKKSREKIKELIKFCKENELSALFIVSSHEKNIIHCIGTRGQMAQNSSFLLAHVNKYLGNILE